MNTTQKNTIYTAVVACDAVIEKLNMSVKDAVALINAYNAIKLAIEAVPVFPDAPPAEAPNNVKELKA